MFRKSASSKSVSDGAHPSGELSSVFPDKFTDDSEIP